MVGDEDPVTLLKVDCGPWFRFSLGRLSDVDGVGFEDPLHRVGIVWSQSGLVD